MPNFRFSSLGAFTVSLLLALFSLQSFAFEVPPLRSPVNDYAKMIPSQSESVLDRAIRELKRQGGTQITLLTLDTLGGEPIEQASIQVTDKWQLGDKTNDRGVLVLVAKKERKIRIEVGQGLEGDLPDAYAKRIIDYNIVPLMREGDVGGAMLVGVYEIVKRTDPQVDFKSLLTSAGYKPSKKKTRHKIPVGMIILIAIFLIFGGRSGLLPLLLLGAGRGGFGGGSFGGGGGWSGGGGGFSGGGASGGW